MNATIIPERLAQLDTLTCDSGGHKSFGEGHCATEIASWLVGDEFTDSLSCMCPVVGGAVRRLNDRISVPANPKRRRPGRRSDGPWIWRGGLP